MKIEVRLFNSLQQPGELGARTVQVRAGTSVADLVRSLGVDAQQVYVAFRNGRPLGRGLTAAAEVLLEEGDVVALSGPVPFSRGYGAPVV